METRESDIAGCAGAHARLVSLIAQMTDADMTRASMLPDWSIGHVLTHLARNAESMCARIEAAARGDIVEQYIGGAAGREAAIEAGANRSARFIERDVTDWSIALDELFSSLDVMVWDRPVRTVSGSEHPVSQLPYRRWREVEIHLVDLGVGPTPSDWPQEFVDRALPSLLTGLYDRTDHQNLMTWLLGRGPAPRLEAWG